MHVKLAVDDGNQQRLLHELGIPCADGRVAIKAGPEQLHKALLAARVQCLSKVRT